MKPISLNNICFSDINRVAQICGHPNNIEIFQDKVKSISDTGCFIDRNRISVISSNYLDEFSYVRTNVLPDNRFMNWVDSLSSPPSWAVYFGLVKKERMIYIVQSDTVTTFDPNRIENETKKMTKILEKYISPETLRKMI